MTGRRGPAILLAALLLAGCWWEGPAFYQPDAAHAGPWPTGLYQVESPEKESPDRLRVGRAPDGALLVATPDDYRDGKPMRVVLTALAAPGRSFWIMQTRTDESAEDVAYGLLERSGTGLVLDPALTCEGNEALVRRAGGVIEGENGSERCVFHDRAALERAARAYVVAHPDLEKPTRLTRLGD